MFLVICATTVSLLLALTISMRVKDFRIEYLGPIAIAFVAGGTLAVGISWWWGGLMASSTAAPGAPLASNPGAALSLAGLVTTLIAVCAIIQVFRPWIKRIHAAKGPAEQAAPASPSPEAGKPAGGSSSDVSLTDTL